MKRTSWASVGRSWPKQLLKAAAKVRNRSDSHFRMLVIWVMWQCRLNWPKKPWTAILLRKRNQLLWLSHPSLTHLCACPNARETTQQPKRKTSWWNCSWTPRDKKQSISSDGFKETSKSLQQRRLCNHPSLVLFTTWPIRNQSSLKRCLRNMRAVYWRPWQSIQMSQS